MNSTHMICLQDPPKMSWQAVSGPLVLSLTPVLYMDRLFLDIWEYIHTALYKSNLYLELGGEVLNVHLYQKTKSTSACIYFYYFVVSINLFAVQQSSSLYSIRDLKYVWTIVNQVAPVLLFVPFLLILHNISLFSRFRAENSQVEFLEVSGESRGQSGALLASRRAHGERSPRSGGAGAGDHRKKACGAMTVFIQSYWLDTQPNPVLCHDDQDQQDWTVRLHWAWLDHDSKQWDDQTFIFR